MFKSKYKILIAVIAGSFILLNWQGCDDSVLDQQPTGFTEATFFLSESDFQEAVFGVYAKMSDVYWFNANNPNHPLWLLPGDALTTAAGLDYEVFAPLDANNGRVNSIWNTFFVLKNRANTVLTKLETHGDVYDDETLKRYHEGEVRFLRAWAMKRIWNHYGAFAPLVDRRITSTEEAEQPSSNPNNPWGTELLDKAIEDLRLATELLPASWPEEDMGRVTANSAYGMLGKILVFRATITGDNSDYNEAITAFNNIQGVRLVDHYRDISSNFSLNNEESLFEYQANNPPEFDNVWLGNDFDIPIGSISAYWGFYSNDPGSWFAGAPIIPTQKLLNTYEEGDPRADWTVGDPELPVTERDQVIKYVFDEVRSSSGVGSMNNPRILRYADVLLLKAEAHLETGNLSRAIELVNQVRERARNSTSPASDAPADRNVNETNADIVFDWIQEERYIELAGEEGHRWWDLRRWHYAGKIDLNDFDFSSIREAFSITLPKHLFLPIPQSELDANSNISQNEGY